MGLRGLGLRGLGLRGLGLRGLGLWGLGLWGLGLWGVRPAQAERPPLNRLQAQLLEDGKVLVSALSPSEASGVAGVAVGLVAAPIEKVWPVVRDCEHYQHFMPKATRSAILKRLSPQRVVCLLEVAPPFPLSAMRTEELSTVTALAGGAWRRSWTLLAGTYKRSTGSWEAYPYGPDRAQTLLVYQIDVDPDVAMPDALLRKGWLGALPDVFVAIRGRLARLGG